MQTVAQTPILCKVTFDRSSREYIVRNGCEIARFPQGEENKVKAQWLAVEHDHPGAARFARELHAGGLDEARALKAARIVIEGKVTVEKHDGDYTRARVEASDGQRSPSTGCPFYMVYHNLTWGCDCADYEFARDNGDKKHVCKHIAAVQIVTRLADEAATEAGNSRGGDTPLPISVDRGGLDEWLADDPADFGNSEVAPADVYPRNAGESIAYMLGQDLTEIRMRKYQRISMTTPSEARRCLASALAPGGGAPLNRPKYQFGNR